MMFDTQHMWGGEAFGWHFFGLMGPLLFILLGLAVIGFLYWGLSCIFTGARPSHREDSANHLQKAHSSALSILAERYARGEIDQTQFENMRRSLAS